MTHNCIKYFHLLFSLFCISFSQASILNEYDDEFDEILESLIIETDKINDYYSGQNSSLFAELNYVNNRFLKSISIKEKVDLLIKKDQFKNQIIINRLAKDTDISKIRYLKGLQIIKILYEKIVSLDHHFASMVTFNEINKISNPNYYPEFNKMKELISQKPSKKQGFELSTLLGENIYTSILHSMISLFSNTNTSREEKEESIKEIECILDFTLRMHTDLNTIYFETAFLQKSNDNIMDELEQLFVDFTKPIDYKIALKICRNNDDWDTIKAQLNSYIKILSTINNDNSQQYKAHKMRINLEFPIDRLLQFVSQYNAFIDQGAKFYEKFEIMLNSYENEEHCSEQIPREYTKLKENIAIAIEKFKTAYKPVEINGSKMKEVLYGINEYD
jgi:hypothetical protein